MKVLLVEDHGALAEVSCNLLRVYDHTVDLARNGAEALLAARRSKPDVILLDLNLPDIDGYSVAATLRADPVFQDTILVALSGAGNTIDVARAAAVGFDAEFTKPMDFDILGSLTRRKGQQSSRVAGKDSGSSKTDPSVR